MFGLLGALVAGGSDSSPSPAALVVSMRPPVGQLGQTDLVTVRGMPRWSSVEIRLEGSTTAIGIISPWVPLRERDGVWSGVIPPLELRGVYPVEIRQRPGTGILRSKRWLFRVLAPGTLSRPAFATPEQVAADWVTSHGTLVAMRRWQLPAYDHRLPALHQLLVVSYSPLGDLAPADRLGIFIMAVRTSFGGRWRFLEATVHP